MRYNAKQDLLAVVAKQRRFLPTDAIFEQLKCLNKRIDSCLGEVLLK